LVARPVDGRLETVVDDSRFVRLGSGVDASGSLDPDRKKAGIDAIRELVARARQAGAKSVKAVATSAVRDAADGPAYVREVRDETGLDVGIIDGDEEARLTYLGATIGVDLTRGALLCDFGGGSCELILADGSGIRWAHSVQIGSGRLSERFVHNDPPSAHERHAIEEYVTGTLRSTLGEVETELAVFTGGTASHIVYLAGLEARAPSGSVKVDLAVIEQVEALVYSTPASQIARDRNVRPERAAVLPAGITGIRSIARWSRARDIFITRNGIREGIIIDDLRREALSGS
jgi:exopolyphosphatase / guanosine-5'-triphosphate,3'-diphosphate pyrophosphatase